MLSNNAAPPLTPCPWPLPCSLRPGGGMPSLDRRSGLPVDERSKDET